MGPLLPMATCLANRADHFDASRAELFEALGHPVRVKILRTLDQRPMGFAELKKAAGIDSSGHLQFHLGKLSGLVETTSEGSYALTDDGREAIRVLTLTSEGKGGSGAHFRLGQPVWTKALVAVLLIAVVLLAGVVVYQQETMPPRGTTVVTSPQPCPGVLAWSSGSNQSTTPVLLMQPNTTAVACITYQTWWQGNPNYNFTGAGGRPSGTWVFYPFSVANEKCSPSPIGCRPVVSNAFRISVSPASVNYSVFTDYVTVLYTITAFANSTGYYGYSVPFGTCAAMPLVVGHSASEINDSVFGPLFYGTCGLLLPFYPVSVSVVGMTVKEIKP